MIRALVEIAHQIGPGILRYVLTSSSARQPSDSGAVLSLVGSLPDLGPGQSINESTPLHLAANVEVVRALLGHAAGGGGKEDNKLSENDKQMLFGLRDWKDRRPLHAASERGKADIVKALIEAGADRRVLAWLPPLTDTRTSAAAPGDDVAHRLVEDDRLQSEKQVL